MTLLYQSRLDLFTTAGVRVAMVADFDWLTLSERVNAPGLLRAQLPGDHAALSLLTHRGLVEYWERFDDDERGIHSAWTRIWHGYSLGKRYESSDEQDPVFILQAPGDKRRLAERIVNWYAGVANRSAFSSVAAETIMKTLVDYNAGANALAANGRLRDGAITGVSVAVDAAGGNVISWYCFGDNLLETLQKLAMVGGGDFDLVKTGAAAWEFRFYAGQLGTDRTATVKFSEEKGNLKIRQFDDNRLGEKTVACVWGQGELSTRDYVTRTGPDYAADNDIEFYVNANDITKGDTAALQARGDQKNETERARETFDFEIIQMPGSAYGVHYFLGDLVSVVNPYTGLSLTQKVVAAHRGLGKDGSRKISVEVETP